MEQIMHHFDQAIYDRRIFKINSLTSLMRKHAELSARGARETWSMEICHDRVTVKFAREDDWQHFCATFLKENGAKLKFRGLLPPSASVAKLWRKGGA